MSLRITPTTSRSTHHFWIRRSARSHCSSHLVKVSACAHCSICVNPSDTRPVQVIEVLSFLLGAISLAIVRISVLEGVHERILCDSEGLENSLLLWEFSISRQYINPVFPTIVRQPPLGALGIRSSYLSPVMSRAWFGVELTD